MSHNKYILDKKGKPKLIGNLLDWAKWMEEAGDQRRVRRTEIEAKESIAISTVFLGLDCSFKDGGTPILYETKVFGGELDQEEERYSTKREAEKGHAKMVKRVRNSIMDAVIKER